MTRKSLWITTALVIAAALGGAAIATHDSDGPAVSAGASDPQSVPGVSAAPESTVPVPQTVKPGACLGTNNDCTPIERERAATATITVDIFAGQPTVNLTPSQAIAKVRADTSEFPTVTRIEAKQTTWLEYAT